MVRSTTGGTCGIDEKPYRATEGCLLWNWEWPQLSRIFESMISNEYITLSEPQLRERRPRNKRLATIQMGILLVLGMVLRLLVLYEIPERLLMLGKLVYALQKRYW